MKHNITYIIIGGAIVIILIIAAFFAGRATPPSQTDMRITASSTASMATTSTSTITTSAPSVTSVSHPTPVTSAPSSVLGSGMFRVGQTVQTPAGYTITVVSVADNRCPIGVVCTSAGTVTAYLKIQKGIFSISQALTLGVPTTEYGFTAELVSVSPQRMEGVTIPQSAYELAFTVK